MLKPNDSTVFLSAKQSLIPREVTIFVSPHMTRGEGSATSSLDSAVEAGQGWELSSRSPTRPSLSYTAPSSSGMAGCSPPFRKAVKECSH